MGNWALTVSAYKPRVARLMYSETRPTSRPGHEGGINARVHLRGYAEESPGIARRVQARKGRRGVTSATARVRERQLYSRIMPITIVPILRAILRVCVRACTCEHARTLLSLAGRFDGNFFNAAKVWCMHVGRALQRECNRAD